MSNELLPSPDILGEPLRDAERATAEIGAAAGDRGILTEYAGGHPETQGFVDTIARLEAAVQERSRETSAAISDQLADLVATIEQIEAVLRPNGVSAPDVHFAVEHIQDIAMALRQREVEAALCDTLDAAVRDVGDAIVRNDAAAARAQSAAELLRDLTRRITDLIALAASVEEPEAKPCERGVDVGAPKHDSNRFDDTLDRPVTDSIEARVVSALMSDDDHAASFLRPALAPLPLPDNEAEAAPQEHPADSFEPVFHKEDGVSEPLSLDSMAAGFAPSHGAEAAATDAPISLPQSRVDEMAPERIYSRIAPNDPLAALHALSEEELIALFT
jgi:hypothetical protein